MKRSICFVTVSRADYGLMRKLLKILQSRTNVNLQLLVTGSHLSSIYGDSIIEIENDDMFINSKLQILDLENSNLSVAQATGSIITKAAKILTDLHSDLVVIIGDRYESFGVATAAHILGIPIAHIHGGEITEGSLDDAFRHSITKMSYIHFVSAEEHKNRVIQLGEDPNHVYQFGGLGAESIVDCKLMEKSEIEKKFNFKFLSKNLIITFHPSSVDRNLDASHLSSVLKALKEFPDILQIFTMPNADSGALMLHDMISNYVLENSNSKYFKSLGQVAYYSVLAQVDGVIGNSSSGLLEAPSFQIGTVNIGDRQRGRLRNLSVIDCLPNESDIVNGINMILSQEFKNKITKQKNVYYQPGTSEKIAQVLTEIDLTYSISKKFFDIPKGKT